jgi:hypothetical protein
MSFGKANVLFSATAKLWMNMQRFQWFHGLRCIDEEARRPNVPRALNGSRRAPAEQPMLKSSPTFDAMA